MPSSRRIKTIATAIAIAICFLLFMSKDDTTQEFYSRTVAALDKKEASDAQAASKLRTIKDPSQRDAPVSGNDASQKPLGDPPTEDESHTNVEVPSRKESDEDDSGNNQDKPDASSFKPTEPEEAPSGEDSREEKSVAGRKKMKGGNSKDMRSGSQSPMDEGKKKGEHKTEKKEKPKSKEQRELEAEMNSILKRGPIIIFSKSWCPYSAKAKRILMDKYTIVPKPHVVELDLHPLGAKLQDALEKSTGRRTVPNILINGKSIGGGDDIESAEIAGTLIEKIKNMGGKRIMEVTQRRSGD